MSYFANEVAGHTGQSSQLFAVATGRNARFVATIQIGLNVSHTDAGSLENDKVWIPLNIDVREWLANDAAIQQDRKRLDKICCAPELPIQLQGTPKPLSIHVS